MKKLSISNRRMLPRRKQTKEKNQSTLPIDTFDNTTANNPNNNSNNGNSSTNNKTKKRQKFSIVLVILTIVVCLDYFGYVSHPEMRNFGFGGSFGKKTSFEAHVIENDIGQQVEFNETITTTTMTMTPETTTMSWNWWEPYVEQLAITYQPSNNTDWCSNGNENQGGMKQQQQQRRRLPNQFNRRHAAAESRSPKTGMFLVKTLKAGSSTAAAVALQLAETVAEQNGLNESCSHHVHHGFQYTAREGPYFLWTTIREPAKRVISEYFFFDISRKSREYQSTKLINLLQKRRNYQVESIGLQSDTKQTLYPISNATKNQIIEIIRGIVNMYHVIAISERLDETLVVMKLLYGFPDEAMIVLSSKQAGGFDDGAFDGYCHAIQKSYTTPDVDDYIDTDFRKDNYDYFLYAVVNQSLDKTIDMLGRDRVERELQRHQELQKVAEEHCMEKAVFPCTKDRAKLNQGYQQSCYFGDVGCGHDCVKQVIKDYIIKKQE